MGDTEHFSDPSLSHLIVQGEDNSGFGWDFGQSFGFDITDSWTQLCFCAGVMFLYGIFLIVYVTTKKFEHKPKKAKSGAWRAWDKNEVHHNLPVVSKHNDFLGWSSQDNAKDFEGNIYLYCMPNGGPYKENEVFIKQRIIKRMKFADLPCKGFFFKGQDQHRLVDRLNSVPKKFPFAELRAALKEIDLPSLPNISISLPRDPKTGCYTIKFSPNFAIDKDFERSIQDGFERLKPDLIEFNKSQGAKPKKLKPIIQPTYVKTMG